MSIETLADLYRLMLLISEAATIFYLLTTDLGQRVVDWLFGRDER